MKNAWLPPGSSSALHPPHLAAGDSSRSPPTPPEPPDPSLSISLFPPLFPKPPKSKAITSPTVEADIVMAEAGINSPSNPLLSKIHPTTEAERTPHTVEKDSKQQTHSDLKNWNIEKPYTILQPKSSSPIFTNKATGSPTQSQKQVTTPAKPPSISSSNSPSNPINCSQNPPFTVPPSAVAASGHAAIDPASKTTFPALLLALQALTLPPPRSLNPPSLPSQILHPKPSLNLIILPLLSVPLWLRSFVSLSTDP